MGNPLSYQRSAKGCEELLAGKLRGTRARLDNYSEKDLLLSRNPDVIIGCTVTWRQDRERTGSRALQIEVTGAGRVWYLVDHEKATIWIDYAGPGHPKATG